MKIQTRNCICDLRILKRQTKCFLKDTGLQMVFNNNDDSKSYFLFTLTIFISNTYLHTCRMKLTQQEICLKQTSREKTKRQSPLRDTLYYMKLFLATSLHKLMEFLQCRCYQRTYIIWLHKLQVKSTKNSKKLKMHSP